MCMNMNMDMIKNKSDEKEEMKTEMKKIKLDIENLKNEDMFDSLNKIKEEYKKKNMNKETSLERL